MRYWYLYVLLFVVSCTDETLIPEQNNNLPADTKSLLELLETNPSDSERIKIYWKLHKAVRETNSPLAIKYLNNQIEIASKTRSNEDLGKAYHGIGYIHYKNKNQIEAVRHYLKSYDNFEIANNPGYQALELNNISTVLMELEDYDYPIEFLLKAERTYKALDDIPNEVMAKMNLGICHMKKVKPDYELAVKYYDEAIKLNEHPHKRQNHFFNRLYNLKGTLKYRLNEYQEAIALFQQSNSFQQTYKEVDEKRMISFYNIGETYSAIGDYENAMSWLNKAKAIDEQKTVREQVVLEWYIIMGSMLNKKEEYGLCAELIQEGIARASKENYNAPLLSMIDLLALSFNELESKKTPVAKARVLQLLNLKIKQEELRKVANQEIHQESMRNVARKEIEINGLKKKLAESRMGEENSNTLATILGVLAGIAISFLFFYLSKYKLQLQETRLFKKEASEQENKASNYRKNLQFIKKHLDECEV